MKRDEIERMKKELVKMRRGVSGGRPAPHKLILVLCVLDMLDAGLCADNRIKYDQELVERFDSYFGILAPEEAWNQCAPPFFHLRSSYFWCHQVIEGREEQYARLRSSGGGSRRVIENISHAFLDEQTFLALSEADARKELRRFVLDRFFGPDRRARLCANAEQQQQIDGYEREVSRAGVAETESDYVRSVAFRRMVTRAYDYRCSACGLRIVVPDIPSPVDAAHLIPWNMSHDDRVSNGLALCKLHHWALDALLIAPTLDHKWRVSRVLDRRRDSERQLTRLDGEEILLPSKSQAYPSREAIQWRLNRILKR